jgi:succinoglycan biosynthesis protein ExoA
LYRPESMSSFDQAPGGPRSSDKVLVVIPCLNERAHIAGLVDKMVQDSAGLDLLVVVADGGSSDGTLEAVGTIANADPRVRVISNVKRIQSAGVNLAARTLGEGRRWLVRIDAHADYPKGYISRLIQEASRTGAASVVVAMTSRGDACFQRAAAVAQNSVLGAGGATHRRGGKAEFVDHGHHALFELKRFLAIGGYDETLSHNEDAEFDVRLTRAGGKIWLTRAVNVVYFPREKPGALFRQYMNYGRGRASTIMRHRMRPKVRQMLPACVLPALFALALGPWLPLAVGPALFWTIACLLIGTALGVRERRRCAYASGLAAMIIHLGWSIGFWSELTKVAAFRAGDTLKGASPPGVARS